MKQRTRDIGESLIEVVMTIVIISVAVTALISSLATAATSSATQRKVQTIDVVVREYAEAIKSATAACSPGAIYTVSYTPPEDFGARFDAADSQPGVCPQADEVQLVTITVSPPNGADRTMTLAVRTS